jgi:hypothetical protein
MEKMRVTERTDCDKVIAQNAVDRILRRPIPPRNEWRTR